MPDVRRTCRCLLVAYLIVAGAWSITMLGLHQNARALSGVPLRIHYATEDGLDANLYALVTGYVAREYGALLEIPDVRVQNDGVFANDSRERYEDDGADRFGPAGLGPSWPGDLGWGALTQGENSLWVTYLKGRGGNYSGLSDFAQRIALYVNSTPGFFYGVWTLWHELGHAAGLTHRSDSPVMAYDNYTVFSYLGMAREWPRPDVLSALENGSLTEVDGARLAWAPTVPYTYGFDFPPLRHVTRDWQRVYWRQSDNWIVSLTLRQELEIRDGVERLVSSGLYRLDVPPEFLLRVFAPLEKRYLDSARGGWPLALPPPPTNPDATNNSTGSYWLRVALSMAADPVFWAGFALITWRCERLVSAFQVGRRKEECDDPA